MFNCVHHWKRSLGSLALGAAAFVAFAYYQPFMGDRLALPAMKWTFRTLPQYDHALGRPAYGVVSAVAAVPFAALCSLSLGRIFPSATYYAWLLLCVGVNVPIFAFAFSGSFSSPLGAFSLFYGYLTLLAMQIWVLLISILRRRQPD